MASIDLLIAAGNSPDMVAQARRNALAVYPEFPHDGCAYFLSELLTSVGMGVGIEGLAQDLSMALQSSGWAKVDVSEYKAGDVGVAKFRPTTHNAAHIYLALARIDDNTARVIDNQAEMPHDRNVGSGPKTPTDYFLRSPSAQQTPITVKVNGQIVEDAAGVIDTEGSSLAWVRPVAEAMGASITDFTSASVFLTLKEQEKEISSEINNGKAFIHLVSLRDFLGVSVTFVEPSTLQIDVA